MPTHTKTVFLPGTLRSADGQRKRDCKVQVARHQTSVDELDRPAKVTYSGLSINDYDDWPDGDYEVEFDGQKQLLTKKGGYYLARR